MRHILQIIFTLILIFPLCVTADAQEKLNQTDQNGKRQGLWIKKYPDGQIMYEGYFHDDKPQGEFKRYDEDGNLISVLNYRSDSDTVTASFYHPNGYIAGKGKYVNQIKTGEWLYYSDYVKDHLLMKCRYEDDQIEGTRIKYHWNGKIAEELEFSDGTESGEWKQYFTDGTLALESTYENGKRNGEFQTWHMSGEPEITGRYVKDVRTGLWSFYNSDGTLRKEIKYNNGIPENRDELIREETEYLDKLEREGGKLKDPEITGIIIK
ncbi:MAG: toxin-antitoxin system YwqK family antitoxin [Bacteroidales bacterium]|nr:toxin-antitoxin system YwqK family antitoxin [Bacteroidales bacterium]